MLNLRQYYQKNRGDTLIEIILGIALLTTVLTSYFSIISFTTKVTGDAIITDEILLNGRFGLEYIKEELKDINKIISSDKITDLNTMYPDNIGFVLMNDNGIVDSDERYKFITYYIKNNELIRIANHSSELSYPSAADFSGYNTICDGIISFNETEVIPDSKIIKLNLSMGKDNKGLHTFKSILYMDLEYEF